MPDSSQVWLLVCATHLKIERNQLRADVPEQLWVEVAARDAGAVRVDAGDLRAAVVDVLLRLTGLQYQREREGEREREIT